MMATCKECLHYEACVLNEAYWVKHNADQACSVFKDKKRRRLIDADEALRMMRNSEEDNPFLIGSKQNAIWSKAHESAIDCVEACDVVDAVPVVRARWEFLTEKHALCTHCRMVVETHLSPFVFLFNYRRCISCGAIMEGEADAV